MKRKGQITESLMIQKTALYCREKAGFFPHIRTGRLRARDADALQALETISLKKSRALKEIETASTARENRASAQNAPVDDRCPGPGTGSIHSATIFNVPARCCQERRNAELPFDIDLETLATLDPKRAMA